MKVSSTPVVLQWRFKYTGVTPTIRCSVAPEFRLKIEKTLNSKSGTVAVTIKQFPIMVGGQVEMLLYLIQGSGVKTKLNLSRVTLYHMEGIN